MSRILPLSQAAICQIHSSKHITSLQGVVLSLLENSLDVGSSKVEVTVDFRRGGCVVEDNGTGIPPAEFLEPSGGLGRMYHTSKRLASANYEFHGSTGTYLASLGALALLGITSRYGEHVDCATLTLHQGKVIERQIPAPARHELTLAMAHGTRVTVRDLFGNMPVRVKQRALATDTGKDDEKAWLELKRGVVGLLLAWHRPCTVRIENATSSGKALYLSAQHPTVNACLTTKALDHHLSGKPKKFDLRDVLPILFQSGFAPHVSQSNWIPVSAASSKVTVKGAICLDPAPTRHCQFISIGIHPCSANDGHTEIYEAVNKIFANSGFGSIEDDGSDIDEVEKDRRERDRRYKREGFTRKQLHGRKGVDRWPMFVLQIKFQERKRVDRVDDASLKAVVEILDATVRQWLEANHFRPRKRTRREGEGKQSPATAQNETGDDNASSLPRSASETPKSETPLLKRSATTGLRTVPKKRKVVNPSDRPRSASIELSRFPKTTHSCFSEWSRIKSGREAFYNEVWQGKKPATAPEGRLGSKTSPKQRFAGTLVLPTVEAGALNKQARDAKMNKDIMSPKSTTMTSRAKQRGEQPISNEDFGSVDEHEMLVVVESVEVIKEDVLDDAVVVWTDPATKQAYRVNARTGVVLPSREKLNAEQNDSAVLHGSASRRSAAINTSISSIGHPLSLSKRPATATKRHGAQWLPGFLKAWDNPVFKCQGEERIPTASFAGPGIDAAEAASRRCTHDARTSYFAEAGDLGTRKLSKAALKKASVIRQVDGKFILCKTQEAGTEVLVLVDQHAASERVILESLLADLCEPDARQSVSRVKTVFLEKPLRFRIPAAEYCLFEERSQHFADWGIFYKLFEQAEEATLSQVRPPKQEHIIIVKALPPGIVERCTLAPKLLIDLLRSEIWTASSSKRPASADRPDRHLNDVVPSGSQIHPLWLARIGSCPKSIIEVLNSRACRSAIMFNDELDLEQCQQLLEKLSRCSFPFMCAHGRVSMVPLVEVGGGEWEVGLFEDGGGRDVDGAVGFSESFKQWRSTYRKVESNDNIQS